MGGGSLFLYGGDSSKEEHASFISLVWFISDMARQAMSPPAFIVVKGDGTM